MEFAWRKYAFLIAYLVLWVAFALMLHVREGFNLNEPVLVFVIVGIGFSALAWWFTRGAVPLPFVVKYPRPELSVLAAYLIPVVGFLTWGINAIETSIRTEFWQMLVILAAKLVVFVAIPLAMLHTLWEYEVRSLVNLRSTSGKHMGAALWMSLVLVLFQIAFGSGPAQLRQSGVGIGTLAVVTPLAYLWLVIEVGLVEEFFFRVLLQSRLAALFRSELAGIVLMSLLFGLAHAPGLYLRPGKTFEAVGPSPSWLMAVGYSIIVTSLAGFFLGVLWSRTKNLLVVVLVHAAGDLIPNLAQFLKIW